MNKQDKRYQVFVSSTYEDLKEERQEVMHALLELDCIPAGMELFTAADEDQWSLIKEVIDDCDYYIVIIGGRYGSEDDEGMSYTEKEYRYALEKNKPTIAFLHKKPDDLLAIKIDINEEKRQKLNEFKKLVSNKMVKHWINAKDLGSVVSRSLIKLIKHHPAIGWVRSDLIPSEDLTAELLKLRRRIEELETELESERKEPPKGTEKYAQGEQHFKVKCLFDAYYLKSGKFAAMESEINLKWNDIFSNISPSMLDENTEYDLKNRINSYISDKFYKQKSKKFEKPRNFRIKREGFDSIIVQFYAVGLIKKSTKKHTASDKNKYWSLSEYGEYTMMQLRALKNLEYFEGTVPEIERKVLIELQRSINAVILELPELNPSDNGYIGKEHVEHLSIHGREFYYLPEIIKDLKFLETIEIQYCGLGSIPKSIGKLSNLKILNLEGNKLEIIPENIGELTNLTELMLDLNDIKKIPDSIGELDNLEKLELFLNQIEYIPKNIEKLKNLKYFSITFNKIDKFPACISTLKNLKNLTFQGDKFTDIPDSIGELDNLEKLWIECDELKNIPSSIKNLKNLTDLNIMCKKLPELPIEIGELTNLKHLDISECSLSTIPESILNLTNLERLRIENNEIRPLSDQIESVLKKLEQQGCKVSKAYSEAID